MDNREHEQDMVLHGLSEEAEEMIAEDYPGLDDAAISRIMKKCGLDDIAGYDKDTDQKKDDIDDGLTVQGTETYRRPVWYRFTAAAAAVVLALAGIGGAVFLSRNGGPTPSKGGTAMSGTTKPDGAVLTAEMTTATEAEEETTVQEHTVSTEPAYIAPVPETTTTASTTATTTSSVTTGSENQQEATTTEAVPEPTTDPAQEATEPSVRLPKGYWVTGNGSSERYWEFYADGTGGTYVDSDTGIGLGFTLDAGSDGLVFHFAVADDETPATVTWHDDGTFTLHWTITGAEELFTPDPEAHIKDF